MTMGRAIALLLLSGLITVVGAILVFARINSGLVDSSIDSRSSGARVGENAATPAGNTNTSRTGVSATLTAVVGSVTALAANTTADLTPVPATPGTGSSGTVGVGQSVDLDGSRFSVIQVADPEPSGFFKPSAGNRLVAIEVSQQALRKRTSFNFTQFKLRDSDDREYSWAITNSEPKFGTGTLQPGKTAKGWISFQVPSGATLDVLIFQAFGRPAVPIVSLR